MTSLRELLHREFELAYPISPSILLHDPISTNLPCRLRIEACLEVRGHNLSCCWSGEDPWGEVFGGTELTVFDCGELAPQWVAFGVFEGLGAVDEGDDAVGVEKSDVFGWDD